MNSEWGVSRPRSMLFGSRKLLYALDIFLPRQPCVAGSSFFFLEGRPHNTKWCVFFSSPLTHTGRGEGCKQQAKQDFSLRRLECALRFVYVTQEGGSSSKQHQLLFSRRGQLWGGKESVFYKRGLTQHLATKDVIVFATFWCKLICKTSAVLWARKEKRCPGNAQ